MLFLYQNSTFTLHSLLERLTTFHLNLLKLPNLLKTTTWFVQGPFQVCYITISSKLQEFHRVWMENYDSSYKGTPSLNKFSLILGKANTSGKTKVLQTPTMGVSKIWTSFWILESSLFPPLLSTSLSLSCATQWSKLLRCQSFNLGFFVLNLEVSCLKYGLGSKSQVLNMWQKTKVEAFDASKDSIIKL